MDEFNTQMAFLLTELAVVETLNTEQFNPVTVTVHGHKTGELIFCLKVSEPTDGHLFISVTARTLTELVSLAREAIPKRCKSWGYK